MQLDRAAEMAFGQAEIGGAEIFLAEAEIVVGILAEQPLGDGIERRQLARAGASHRAGRRRIGLHRQAAGRAAVDCVVSDFGTGRPAWSRSRSR